MQRRRRWLPYLAAAAILVPIACGELRDDEFECEQAVSHLTTCCTGFRAQAIACNFNSGCGTTTYPALSVADSECIEAKSCDQIVSAGICERAQMASSVEVDDDGGVISSHGKVCP